MFPSRPLAPTARRSRRRTARPRSRGTPSTCAVTAQSSPAAQALTTSPPRVTSPPATSPSLLHTKAAVNKIAGPLSVSLCLCVCVSLSLSLTHTLFHDSVHSHAGAGGLWSQQLKHMPFGAGGARDACRVSWTSLAVRSLDQCWWHADGATCSGSCCEAGGGLPIRSGLFRPVSLSRSQVRTHSMMQLTPRWKTTGPHRGEEVRDAWTKVWPQDRPATTVT